MGTVNFKATFPPGAGTLSILIDGNPPPLDFTGDGLQSIDLPAGDHDYSCSGAAPAQGGLIQLEIIGDVIADSPKSYGPRLFDPDDNTFIVTDPADA